MSFEFHESHPASSLATLTAIGAATRLLVVEGVPGDAERLAALGDAEAVPLDVLAAATLGDALDELLSAPVDVVVLAEHPSGETGGADVLDALAQLRGVALDVPVVLLAAHAGRERVLEAMHRGAQDVLVRAGLEAGDADLVRRIELAIARVRVDTELARQAMHDALTGLPNRVLLRDRLAQALGRLGRHEGAVALLVLDLDGFKARQRRARPRGRRPAADRRRAAPARRPALR